jgi:hypothetical protein
VLEGAINTLHRYRPVLMMEVTMNLPVIDQLLKSLGYEYFSAMNGQKVAELKRELVAIPK